MDELLKLLSAAAVGAAGGSGFWAFLTHRLEHKTATTQMVMALVRERIRYLGQVYIDRGWVTPDEYENLCDMYEPYKQKGGNGSAKRIMEKVKALPTHEMEVQP